MKRQHQDNAARRSGQTEHKRVRRASEAPLSLRAGRCIYLLVIVCLSLLPRAAAADARSDTKALLATRRIAVVAPFFCSGPTQAVIPPRRDAEIQASKSVAHVTWPDKSTPPARKPRFNKDLPPAAVKVEPSPKSEAHGSVPAPTEAANAPAPSSTDAFYRDALTSLSDVVAVSLPDRLAEGGRFTVVPAPFVQQALRALHWQARDLFLPSHDNAKFPTPDSKRLQQLAGRLHVDAVLVGTMREPASIGDGLRLPFEMWRVNPLDMGVRRTRAHVLSPRIHAFLVTAQGSIAWQDEQMADHPRTTPHTTRTLLVDWQEATEQVAQQLADSLRRTGAH